MSKEKRNARIIGLICFYVSLSFIGLAWYLILTLKAPISIFSAAIVVCFVSIGYGLLAISERLRGVHSF